MQLGYLLFDATDEESGSCSFDAMASVPADRVAPLLREVEAVLGWAHRSFGPPAEGGGGREGGEWDFALHASDEDDAALEITYDPKACSVSLRHLPGHLTLTLTLAGSPAFAQAFRSAFPDPQ